MTLNLARYLALPRRIFIRIQWATCDVKWLSGRNRGRWEEMKVDWVDGFSAGIKLKDGRTNVRVRFTVFGIWLPN